MNEIIYSYLEDIISFSFRMLTIVNKKVDL